jgi:hypothetical protein
MSNVVSALLPVFLLIALGWWLKRKGFPGDAFWAPAERLVYFVFFPSLLVTNLSEADLDGLSVGPMATAMVLAVVAMAAIALLLRRRLGLGDPAFTSFFQGAVRSNAYVALAVAGAIFGEAGLTLAAIATAVVVPTVNVLCVTALAHYSEGQRPSLRGILKLLSRNPLILGCLAGILLNVGGAHLPGVIHDPLVIMGRATLPLALTAVGAGLSLKALNHTLRPVFVAALCKLAVLPLLTALACALFGVEGITRAVAILFTAMPTAASSYVLARQLGGDAGLMASMVTVSTLAALISLTVLLTLLG